MTNAAAERARHRPQAARRHSVLVVVASLVGFWSLLNGRASADDVTELLTAEPYDVIVMRDGAPLRVFPLDLPERRMPSSPPATPLRTRTLERPAEPLAIDWQQIERIDFFERRLLDEAQRQASGGDSARAFDCFSRLEREYPDLEGLEEATIAFLKREALAAFRDGRHEEALVILGTLVERAPAARGIEGAVNAVGGAILDEHWRRKDFPKLRVNMDLLETRFPGLARPLADRWRTKITALYEVEIDRAKQLAEAGAVDAARAAAAAAAAIEPRREDGLRLLRALDAADPTVRVAVFEDAGAPPSARLDAPAGRRRARLAPASVAWLDDYGPGGGVYTSPLGSLGDSGDPRTVTLHLEGTSLAGGQGPHRLARELLALGVTPTPPWRSLAGRVETVAVSADGQLVVRLARAHPRPAALLRGPLPASLADLAPQPWEGPTVEPLQGVEGATEASDFRSNLPVPAGAFERIREVRFTDDGKAVAALLAGQVHVLADVPPWRIAALRERPEVTVGEYRLPVVHCLLVGPGSPLRASRDARRGVCYAVDPERFVLEQMLGGVARQGCQAVSSPFPAGATLADPLRYAYNDTIKPRPFEPRLAALLLALVGKTAAADAALEGDGDAPPESEDDAPRPEAKPLVLVHADTPLVRLGVAWIVDRLGALGQKVETRVATEAELVSGAIPYDLRYAELTINEPMVDAWALVGPGGLAGDCSESLVDVLSRLDQATNGKQASDALRAAHEVIATELPLLPLWQVSGAYAWRRELDGLPAVSVDLYQSVDRWRRRVQEARR